MRAYQDFHDKIAGIRTIVALVKERTAPAARAKAPAKGDKPAARPKTAPAQKSATGDKAPHS